MPLALLTFCILQEGRNAGGRARQEAATAGERKHKCIKKTKNSCAATSSAQREGWEGGGGVGVLGGLGAIRKARGLAVQRVGRQAVLGMRGLAKTYGEKVPLISRE